jgi:hypothetical protein
MKFLFSIVTGCLVFGLLGCGNDSSNSLWEQIKLLGQEKTDLKLHVEKLESENEDLSRQVEKLSALGAEKRVDVLSKTARIKIGRRSGLFDRDNDGKKEKLIVYVKTIDEADDAVKAAGEVAVQLWDLNAEQGEALLGKWEIGPAELKQMWAGTVMTNYYRLEFDVSELVTAEQQELTVKVRFTDYVTGKVFREQRVIGR